MTILQVMTEISKRINDAYKITYTDSLIKTYLLKSMNIVFSSERVTESDYFGLMVTESVNSNKVFSYPVKQVIAVTGSTGDVLYIPKTPQEIASIAGQKHLQPFKGQVFYSVFGNGIRFFREGEIDVPVSVDLVKYPFDTEDDLTKFYSDYFVELSIRETIKQIITEIGVPNDRS